MNLYQIQKRARTLWKKTVALLVMAIVVSAGYCQTVQAREQFEVRRLRFVQPDVIYFHMIDYERKGTYTGLYNISTGLFTPLTTVSDGEFVPVNSEITNHPPAFIWKLKDKWVIADQNGAVDSFEQELQGSERILRIFPEKQLAILPDPSLPIGVNTNYVLQNNAAEVVGQFQVSQGGDAVSPAFGKKRNFFLVNSLPPYNRASLFSIKPLREISSGPFPRYDEIEYVYDEKSTDLVAVLSDGMDSSSISPGQYRFVRIRHMPDNTEQAFAVEEFASLKCATKPTWRNGMIFDPVGEGVVAIEKREPGKEPQAVLAPFNDHDQQIGDGDFAVSGDGSLLCVYSVFPSVTFSLYKIDFPTVRRLGDYVAQWDADTKLPRIEKRANSEVADVAIAHTAIGMKGPVKE